MSQSLRRSFVPPSASKKSSRLVTDHHLIDAHRIKNLARLVTGQLTVFPGIELRSELGSKKSVHLIGIFSESADLDYLWTKLQGLLGITPKEAQEKGDDNVYVQFERAATSIHELGGYVSVHAPIPNSQNGTSEKFC